MEEQKVKLVIEPELSVEENNLKIIENIKYNTTFSHKIENFGFGNLEQSAIINIYKDGRPFSHFIEAWLAIKYPLIHITGCKKYDHIYINDENIDVREAFMFGNKSTSMDANISSGEENFTLSDVLIDESDGSAL